MPAKKITTVEIAAMRSEFHKGYQSIEHLPFAASGGRFAKGTILSVRMAPFVSPQEAQGAFTPSRHYDSRASLGAPIVPLPRNRLASSATGGASPVSLDPKGAVDIALFSKV